MPLLVALWLVAALQPLPYVTYQPGPTIDVLGTHDRQGDHRRSPGTRPTATTAQLRMTTVYVDPARRTTINLFDRC